MSKTEPSAVQLFEQGRDLRISGEYDLAVACLQQALEKDPNHAQAHMELGLTYCFSGLFAEALTELQLAAGLDTGDLEIVLHLAKAYTMVGMFAEGRELFERILIIAPPSHPCYAEAEKQLIYFDPLPPADGALPPPDPTSSTY